MPQGLFLESMGIRLRLEQMQQRVTSEQAKLLEVSYERLCDPKQMGEIYKVLMLQHREVKGDIYPFLGEDTVRKEGLFGWLSY